MIMEHIFQVVEELTRFVKFFFKEKKTQVGDFVFSVDVMMGLVKM